jgi:hypothetical protein
LRDWPNLPRVPTLAHFVVGLGIAFPVAFAIAIKAVLFDGMRHFIFVLPLIAVVAAVVADRICARMAHYRCSRLIYVMLLVYIISHVSIMTMLHQINMYIITLLSVELKVHNANLNWIIGQILMLKLCKV